MRSRGPIAPPTDGLNDHNAPSTLLGVSVPGYRDQLSRSRRSRPCDVLLPEGVERRSDECAARRAKVGLLVHPAIVLWLCEERAAVDSVRVLRTSEPIPACPRRRRRRSDAVCQLRAWPTKTTRGGQAFAGRRAEKDTFSAVVLLDNIESCLLARCRCSRCRGRTCSSTASVGKRRRFECAFATIANVGGCPGCVAGRRGSASCCSGCSPR